MAAKRATILVVADDPREAAAVSNVLDNSGQFVPLVERQTANAYDAVTKRRAAVVVIDTDLANLALGFLKQMRPRPDEIPVIVMSGRATSDLIRQVLVAGAADFVARTPESIRALPRILARAMERSDLAHEIQKLQARIDELEGKSAIPDVTTTRVAPGLDPLTGTLTRQAFFAGLREEFLADHAVSIILAKVSGMKQYNSEFGEEGGDLLLQGIAQSCIDSLQPTDLAARYDGDVFAILIPQDEKRAEELAERIQDLVDQRARQKTIPGSTSLLFAIRSTPFATPEIVWDAESGLS